MVTHRFPAASSVTRKHLSAIAKGFSLIELMVAVAIVGIIAAIAYPSYQGYVCDTYQGQAIADLKVCALAMDRYFSNDFTYAGAVINGTASSICPNQSPSQGPAQYTIALTSATANDYTLQATKASGNSCDGGGFQLTADGTQTQL